MTLWISAGILFIISTTALLVPLMRRKKEMVEDQEKLVYLDQLTEIDRDLDRFLITEQEADQIRLEITRRMAKLDASTNQGVNQYAPQKSGITLILCLVALVPLTSIFIYTKLGSPDKEDLPFASRNIGQTNSASAGNSGFSQSEELHKLADNLANKLINNPENMDGWMLLGRTYMTLERWRDAAGAFSSAYNISPTGPDIAASYAEALYMSAGAKFTAQSKTVLQSALKFNSRDPKSLFYWGLAMANQNKHKEALQAWINLMSISSAGSPWMPTLRQRIRQSANVSGIDVAQIKPTLKPDDSRPTQTKVPTPPQNIPGPTREDVEAASQMSQEERMDFVRSMVNRLADRLKDQPNDLQGWKRLARAYRVLGETEKARAAQVRIQTLEKSKN